MLIHQSDVNHIAKILQLNIKKCNLMPCINQLNKVHYTMLEFISKRNSSLYNKF